MTGKDFIMYILANKLEDEPLYKDGKLLGFMTAKEAAIKFDVGIFTIHQWISSGLIDCIEIGYEIYIPENAKSPMTKGAVNE